MRYLLLLPATLLMGALATPACASVASPPGDAPCQDSPSKCAEMKARREQFCKTNPLTCKKRKALRTDRRKYCAEHPDKCKTLKEERKARQERRQERREEYCKAHPGDCKGGLPH